MIELESPNKFIYTFKIGASVVIIDKFAAEIVQRTDDWQIRDDRVMSPTVGDLADLVLGKTADFIDGNFLHCRVTNLKATRRVTFPTYKVGEEVPGLPQPCAAAIEAKKQGYKSIDKTVSSIYLGVSYEVNTKKYRANVNNQKIGHVRIGSYATQLEAALAYDKYVREKLGPNAVVNFPDKLEQVQLGDQSASLGVSSASLGVSSASLGVSSASLGVSSASLGVAPVKVVEEVAVKPATAGSNVAPYCKYRGVTKSGSFKNPWKALLTVNYKRIALGNFKTAEDAARAYDEAVRQHCPPGTPVNFPKTEV